MPKTSLLPYQRRAVREVEGFDMRALICMDPGLGKTIVSLSSLARNREVAMPAVVVCPAAAKYVWESEAKQHCGWPVTICEGREPPKQGLQDTSGLVVINYDILKGWVRYLRELNPQTIIFDECQNLVNRQRQRTRAARALAATVPCVFALSGTPLMNRPAELWPILNILRPDLYPAFWPYAHKYCLPPDAPILMADFTEKPISEIKIGDEIVGWQSEGVRNGKKSRRRRIVKSKVLDVITKTAPLQRVWLSNGDDLICTPDHQWATGRSLNCEYAYRPAIAGRIEGGGGKGKSSRVMPVFRGTSPIYSETSIDYVHGYIHGFCRGDGWCSRTRSRRESPFKDKARWLKFSYAVGAACVDKEPIDRISRYLSVMGESHSVTQRSDGLWAISGLANKRGYRLLSQVTAERQSDEWWAGFLGGIYDSEGSGRSIAQYEAKNPSTFKMIETAFDRFGIKYSVDKPRQSLCMQGGRKTFLRFWNIANPTLRRKLLKVMYSAGGKFMQGYAAESETIPCVDVIRPLEGEHLTYTLTTETGNYVAYGYGSKNCSPRRRPWGWEYKGANRLDELNAELRQNLMLRYRKSEVLHELPPKFRSTVACPLTGDARAEYRKASTDFMSWLRQQDAIAAAGAARAPAMTMIGHLLQLVARLKFPLVVKWANDFLVDKPDEKLILFGYHRKMIEALQRRVKAKSVVIYGGVTGRARQAAIHQFQTDKRTRVAVNQLQAGGVAATMTAATNVAFTQMWWRPGDFVQAGDRIHRIGQTQTTYEHWLICPGTIEEKLCKVLEEKQAVLSAVLDGGSQDTDLDVYTRLMLKIREEGL